jgi:hypothetical protein
VIARITVRRMVIFVVEHMNVKGIITTIPVTT